jgi:hypothetical protein
MAERAMNAVVSGRQYGKAHYNREVAAASFAFVERDPVSGLVMSMDNDLNKLVLGALQCRWRLFKEEAQRYREIAVHEAHKGPAKFVVRMEPTDRWGLPTLAADAYAPALVLEAGDTAFAFSIIFGAREDQVRAALGLALVEIKSSQNQGA